MKQAFRCRIFIFYCVNAFDGGVLPSRLVEASAEFQLVKLPCSSMVRDVFLLRSFESGADGVVVLACPTGKCQRLDGNERARKRVTYTQGLLDEIGLCGRRLAFAVSDQAEQTIKEMLSEVAKLGPNPARAVLSGGD